MEFLVGRGNVLCIHVYKECEDYASITGISTSRVMI
jgi:hypothetical protein